MSVIITTKNEACRIARCLEALESFDDIWVVDSNSTDKTLEIAAQHGANIATFAWNGLYPKKRQWCLDTLDLAHDFVFFVDADEIVPPALVKELSTLTLDKAGYFVRGRYIFGGKLLKFGLCNNKLALLDRRKMEFPVVDDLDMPGMGEMEGHYQPVLRSEHRGENLGQLKTPLVHDAYADRSGWLSRHRRYAQWEASMNRRKAWPADPNKVRQALKTLFRALPFRPAIAFVHCYILKGGFLDGRAGFHFARTRLQYYRAIRKEERCCGS